MHGCYAMTATTALTVQNTLGVEDIYVTPSDFVRKQIDACINDIGVDVVKTGMTWLYLIFLSFLLTCFLSNRGRDAGFGRNNSDGGYCITRSQCQSHSRRPSNPIVSGYKFLCLTISGHGIYKRCPITPSRSCDGAEKTLTSYYNYSHTKCP